MLHTVRQCVCLTVVQLSVHKYDLVAKLILLSSSDKYNLLTNKFWQHTVRQCKFDCLATVCPPPDITEAEIFFPPLQIFTRLRWIFFYRNISFLPNKYNFLTKHI